MIALFHPSLMKQCLRGYKQRALKRVLCAVIIAVQFLYLSCQIPDPVSVRGILPLDTVRLCYFLPFITYNYCGQILDLWFNSSCLCGLIPCNMMSFSASRFLVQVKLVSECRCLQFIVRRTLTDVWMLS